METLSIPSDIRTPEIQFNWGTGVFLIRGESYPEDVRKFYDYPMGLFQKWIQERSVGSILFEFDLIYFNSSSAKVLMDLFLLLERAAADGCDVSVIWHCASDDDNTKELGEEFGLELKFAKFQLCQALN